MTPPGRPRASSPPTAAARGAATSASRRSPARTCARTSPPPSRSSRRVCTSPRSACTRSTSTAPRSATPCSRPAGPSTPSASRPRPTTSPSLVKQGDNAIGAILGDGWYSTRLQGGKKWGTNPALLAQLKITYTDGTTTRVTTDNTWQAGRGGLQTTGIYDGETYDARLDKPGWDQPGFNAGWPSAVERNETMAVEPSQAPPIKVIDTLAAQGRHPARRPAPRSTTSARTSPAGRASRPTAPRARRSGCASASSSTATARSTPPTCAPRSRPTPTRSEARAPRPTSRASPTTASATSR